MTGCAGPLICSRSIDLRISRWALAALVPIVALTFLMVSAPQSAEAAGPTTLGRSPWQFMRGPIVAPVPDYGSHGHTSEYGHLPAPGSPQISLQVGCCVSPARSALIRTPLV